MDGPRHCHPRRRHSLGRPTYTALTDCGRRMMSLFPTTAFAPAWLNDSATRTSLGQENPRHFPPSSRTRRHYGDTSSIAAQWCMCVCLALPIPLLLLFFFSPRCVSPSSSSVDCLPPFLPSSLFLGSLLKAEQRSGQARPAASNGGLGVESAFPRWGEQQCYNSRRVGRTKRANRPTDRPRSPRRRRRRRG